MNSLLKLGITLKNLQSKIRIFVLETEKTGRGARNYPSNFLPPNGVDDKVTGLLTRGPLHCLSGTDNL